MAEGMAEGLGDAGGVLEGEKTEGEVSWER